jgi:aryl-alcohol dehydrogenase-like predicted oxidoreductase
MKNDPPSQMVLGTAQMGMPYGIANFSAVPSESLIQEYIEFALERGINSIDTARGYGMAEVHLGRSIGALGIGKTVRVFTKLTETELSSDEIAIESIENSLNRLGVSKLHGLYAHFLPTTELEQLQIIQRLTFLKQRGYTSHIGFSLYDTNFKRQRALEHEIDLFQAPINVLDRRAIHNGFMHWCTSRKKIFVIRSIFLQGLLCNSEVFKVRLKEHFQTPIKEWFDLCEEKQLTPTAAALQIAMVLSEGNPIIVGFDSLRQLKENLHQISLFDFDDALRLTRSTLGLSQRSNFDRRLIEPNRWSEIMKDDVLNADTNSGDYR